MSFRSAPLNITEIINQNLYIINSYLIDQQLVNNQVLIVGQKHQYIYRHSQNLLIQLLRLNSLLFNIYHQLSINSQIVFILTGLALSLKMQDLKNNQPITIYNICGVFSIKVQNIDLSLLAVKMSNSSYNAKKLPALVIRKTNPKATILLFKTGKSILLGTESVQNLQKIAHKLGKELKKLLLIKELKWSQVIITNIMAGCNLDFRINLGKLSQDRKSIKNEGIPGVLYQLGQPVKKVMVHKSGNIIVAGAKSVQAVQQTYVLMKRLMRDYELKQEQTFIDQN